MRSRSERPKGGISPVTELLLVALIVGVTFGVHLSLSLQTPVYSDGTLYAAIVRDIARTGQIPASHPNALAAPEMSLPVFYPQLFFVLVAVFGLYVGEIAFSLIPALSGALVVLAMYLLARRFMGRNVFALIVPAVLVGSFYLMLFSASRFKADIYVAFMFIIFLYAFLRALESKRALPWVFSGAIVLAGAIGGKQYGLFLFFLLLTSAVALVLLRRGTARSKALRRIALLTLVTALVSVPVLWFQFSTTGTVSYPTNYVEPLNTIEAAFADVLGINRWLPNPAYIENVKFSAFGLSRIQDALSPAAIIDYLSPFSGPGGGLLTVLFLAFSALGVFRILKERQFELLLFLVFFFALLLSYIFYIQSPEHNTVLPILATVFLALGVQTTVEGLMRARRSFARIASVLILAAIVVAASVSLADSYLYFDRVSRDQTIKMGEFEDLGDWLMNNTSSDVVIITSRFEEVGYYTDRQTIWLNVVDGTVVYYTINYGNLSEIVSLMQSDRTFYIVVPVWWIGNPESWVGFMSGPNVKMIKDSELFQVVYRTPGILVIRLDPGSSGA